MWVQYHDHVRRPALCFHKQHRRMACLPNLKLSISPRCPKGNKIRDMHVQCRVSRSAFMRLNQHEVWCLDMMVKKFSLKSLQSALYFLFFPLLSFPCIAKHLTLSLPSSSIILLSLVVLSICCMWLCEHTDLKRLYMVACHAYIHKHSTGAHDTTLEQNIPKHDGYIPTISLSQYTQKPPIKLCQFFTQASFSGSYILMFSLHTYCDGKLKWGSTNTKNTISTVNDPEQHVTHKHLIALNSWD